MIDIEPQLNIRRITEWDERIAAHVYIPAGEECGIEPEKRNLKNPNYYLFAGFAGDDMVSVLSLHTSLHGCTRFDYILTAPSHRGKGYAKEMQLFATDFCRKHALPHCFTWYASPYSAKIGYASGFRQAFAVETGSAFCE